MHNAEFLLYGGSGATEESPGWFVWGATIAACQVLLSFSRSAALASDANPAKRIAAEKEEQGSERSFHRKAEAEPSGLCDDAIPGWLREGNDNVLRCP